MCHELTLQVDIVIDGFPCKSLSKQNCHAQSFLDTKSKTGEGYQSLLAYVDYAQPKVIVCENVAVMLHNRQGFGGEKPIDIQQEAFRRRGYHGSFQLMNSKDFGLRQCRTRVYSVYVKELEVNLTRYLG